MGVLALGTKSVMEVPECEKLKREKEPGLVCGYITIWLPFEITSVIIQQLIFFVQFAIVICVAVPAPTVVFFGNEVTAVFGTHIKHLKSELRKCWNIKDCMQRKIVFRKWIKYHVYLVE